MTPIALLAIVLPVATLVLGWVLNEISQHFRIRGQQRGAVGRALAELLDVRHRLQAVQVVFDEVRRRFPVTAQQEIQAATWIEHFLPPAQGLAESYSRSLSELAETAPLLAFRLRGKEMLLDSLTHLRGVFGTDTESSSPALCADRFLRGEALGALDEAIRELAWKHGLTTWWGVRGHLRRPNGGMHAEVGRTLERLTQSITFPDHPPEEAKMPK